MSKKDKYKHCGIVKKVESGILKQMVWIPSKYAVLGEVIKIRENDEWIDGWVVKQVSIQELMESELPDFRKSVRVHRNNTGDSLKK